MIKQESKYAAILKLKTNESIADEIASRQLGVIEKAYDYLAQEGNNIIYIADEVGLGKTYIALGIATLFRHFSNDRDNYRDLIIVPKKNLQQKWQKELKNFFANNYLPECSFWQHDFQERDFLKERLTYISKNDVISIFRMTSFSSLSTTRRSDFYRYLCDELFTGDTFSRSLLSEAKAMGYFKANEGKEPELRKLIAYLLNIKSEKIDCLIIDEAHNYKYGIGTEYHDNAIRNEVTARFLGAVKDKKLLNQFPSLKGKIKFPLAKKVICLSATPKDRSLLEIKNQFSCFTNDHILGNAYTPKDVEQKLKYFLIRGNMEYNISGGTISRNQCRFEHRQGNVNKSEIAEPLIIEDDFNSVFWQLLQYKSIKHLNQKHNASFEIGMLAGFESYRLDMDKAIQPGKLDEDEEEEEIIDGKEYEYTSKRNLKTSHDLNIIKQLLESYSTTFRDIPPHPKQTKLEDEVINQIKKQEKSLIFVRRVATAYELEKRLTQRFEKEVVVDYHLNLDGRFAKYNTPQVKKLKSNYSERFIREKLPDFFSTLLQNKKICKLLKAKGTTETQSVEWLSYTYDSLDNDSQLKRLIIRLIQKSNKTIPKKMIQLCVDALSDSYSAWNKEYTNLEVDGEDGEESEATGYFFNNYFKKGQPGFKFRQKLYRENWFELNLFLLINRYNLIEYDANQLLLVVQNTIPKDDSKKSQTFDLYQQAYKEFIISSERRNTTTIHANQGTFGKLADNTFLTSLLLQECKVEFQEWISKRGRALEVHPLLKDFEVLTALIKSIFRNGSGLLPAFIADSVGGDFDTALRDLMKEDAPFHFVLKEIQTVISDYDMIVSTNFQERDERKVSTTLRGLTPVLGISGQAKRDRSIVATQFRTPGYPYVLVTTDIFKEGEDLHTYCQNVYHYGIAWNPSDMEQRTGRIDRINSLSYRKLNKQKEVHFDNKIHVFYPYLSQSVEVNQVVRLLVNINKFIKTFNDIEAEVHYESSVKVDDMFTNKDIPDAITEKLISKYDVVNFNL